MLQLRNVSQQFDDQAVLRDIDLTVEEGEIVCLLGASGSGKTTLLRIIAGLVPDFSGDVRLDGEPLRDAPVHQRGFGLVFQDFALFPHLSVAQNVAFGLEMQGLSAQERQRRVAEMLELVQLSGFGDRDVSQLSGGEKQRVALARSLAPRPRLLMLDEPLGSLDASLRSSLVLELRQIIKRMGVTAVYVTHDQEEAYAVADRIAVMNAGIIEQVDTPQEIYHHPRTVYVARFLGLENIFSSSALHLVLNDLPDADYILLHPVGLQISEKGTLQGEVEQCRFQGSRYLLTVRISPEIALQLWASSSQVVPQAGQQVAIQLAPEWIIPLNMRVTQ